MRSLHLPRISCIGKRLSRVWGEGHPQRPQSFHRALSGAGSRLRKYTIGPYGRVTLHQARAAALKIFAARTEGRDPASEKQQVRRRLVADRVEDVAGLQPQLPFCWRKTGAQT